MIQLAKTQEPEEPEDQVVGDVGGDATSADAADDEAQIADSERGEAELQLEASAAETEVDAPLGPGNEQNDEQLLRAASALIFASPEPLSERRLVQLLQG